MPEEGSTEAQQAAAGHQEEQQGNTYVIRPNYQNNVYVKILDKISVMPYCKEFRPVMVKEMIHFVLTEHLSGKTYDPETTTDTTKAISDTIKMKLKDMGYDRYKFIVQVVIAEQRGQGTKMACRCFWDSDTDNYAQDLYMNDSLVCVAAAYGIFHY